MLSQKDIYKKTYAVRRQLDEKLGVRGRDLGHALRKAGRRLPVAIRAHAGTLAEAEFFAENQRWRGSWTGLRCKLRLTA